MLVRGRINNMAARRQKAGVITSPTSEVISDFKSPADVDLYVFLDYEYF